MQLDLNIYPLSYQQGELQPDTKGFFVFQPIKRSVRSRKSDILILFLDVRSEKQDDELDINNWLKPICNDFFKLSGSVTSAMRNILDRINLYLLENNLNSASIQKRISASLLLCVVHNEIIFLSQCGSAHGYLIKDSEFIHFFDQDVAENNLGISRVPKIRYYQELINADDALILSKNPPDSWNAQNLLHQSKSTIEQLWRRIHNQIPKNQEAALIHFQKGDGKIQFINYQEKNNTNLGQNNNQYEPENKIVTEEKKMEEKEQFQSATITPPNLLEESLERSIDDEVSDHTSASHNQDQFYENEKVVENKKDESIEEREITQQDSFGSEEEIYQEKTQVEIKNNLEQEKSGLENSKFDGEAITKKGLGFLAKSLRGIKKTINKLENGFSYLWKKISGKNVQSLKNISDGTKLIIAIIVPILLVALAASVYLYRGENRQYDLHLALGKSALENANQSSNSQVKRDLLDDALNNAELASEIKDTDEVEELINNIQNELNILDGVKRINFERVFYGDATLNVTKILTGVRELFVFDDATNQVLNLKQSEFGYVVNESYKCGTEVNDSNSIGQLLDILYLTNSNNIYDASVLAVNDSGSVLFCSNKGGQTVHKLTAPELGWGRIRTATLGKNGELLILDSQNNQIWAYYGTGYEYNDSPEPYFSSADRNLENVISFLMEDNHLFFLHEDGHLSNCEYSTISGFVEKCTDPSILKDGREDSGDVDLTSLQFTKISFSTTWDPSLYLLNPEDMSIYQFSYRMNLNRIYHAEFNDKQTSILEPTAISLSQSQTIFLVFHYQIFEASIN